MFSFQSEIITSKGYPCEEHTVQTQDGFLLTMQRIPHGRNKHGGAAPRGVAFLQHGLLGAATNWIANSANQSLGKQGMKWTRILVSLFWLSGINVSRLAHLGEGRI